MGSVVLYLLVATVATVMCTVSTPSQYLATLHHSPPDYVISKRDINNMQFVGDLIINNTVNENGEVTVSLCDITQSIFGGITSYQVFDIEKSASVGVLASVDVTASLDVSVNVNGCLQFYYNPCCQTIGVRFVLEQPLVLSATGSVSATLQAFSFGVSAGSSNVGFNPLNNINLAGFNPTIGSWMLPPILDNLASLVASEDQYCAQLGLPGNIIGLKFCVVLGNFSAGLNGVNVCPRVTIYFGTQKLLDVSYASISGNSSECLAFSFIPQCQRSGSVVPPNIMQLFKSIDLNNDFKLALGEIINSKALLGVYNTKSTNSESYQKMDENADGDVDFDEFQKYTTTQNETFTSSPYASSQKHFSGGDIALAVIMTMLGTTLIVGAALVVFAQYKGIIKLEWLGKVVPTKV